MEPEEPEEPKKPEEPKGPEEQTGATNWSGLKSNLKGGNRQLVKGGGALFTCGRVQIQRSMQGGFRSPLIGRLLDRPV